MAICNITTLFHENTPMHYLEAPNRCRLQMQYEPLCAHLCCTLTVETVTKKTQGIGPLRRHPRAAPRAPRRAVPGPGRAS